ncbi:hypothetical protein CDAR_598431 [Caerostris darwini]|uniref:Uncharacterized protein n=1 Tax=Caerostris darwini TaxID=1538125 RepID=A0AAV4QKD2_9ARAC|nr:hypothetical protein CDAR_598431 [Caerostris darwini]
MGGAHGDRARTPVVGGDGSSAFLRCPVRGEGECWRGSMNRARQGCRPRQTHSRQFLQLGLHCQQLWVQFAVTVMTLINFSGRGIFKRMRILDVYCNITAANQNQDSVVKFPKSMGP